MKVTTLTNFISEQVIDRLDLDDSFDITMKFSDLENAINKVNPDLEIEDIELENFICEYEED